MKNFSKKGFSLLEVMLAVAIMATASSMIMYGFLTSMNYANNSSIYARVAAANASRNYDNMADVMAINFMTTGATSRYATLEAIPDGNDQQVKIEGGSLDMTVDLRTFRYDGEATGGTNTNKFDITAGAVALNSDYAIAVENTGTYADTTVTDNRTSFFYTVPDVDWAGYHIENGECPICGEPFTLVMMRRGSEPAANGNFHWVCRNYNDDTQHDHSAYRAAVLDEAYW